LVLGMARVMTSPAAGALAAGGAAAAFGREGVPMACAAKRPAPTAPLMRCLREGRQEENRAGNCEGNRAIVLSCCFGGHPALGRPPEHSNAPQWALSDADPAWPILILAQGGGFARAAPPISRENAKCCLAAIVRPILQDAAARLLRMRSEGVARMSNPHGEEARSAVSNHEARKYDDIKHEPFDVRAEDPTSSSHRPARCS